MLEENAFHHDIPLLISGTIYYPPSMGFPYGLNRTQEPQHGHPRSGTQHGSNGNDRYNCPKCGRSYQHLHHMLRHCKFECGSPPRFQCPYCQMRSKQSNNVYKHIRVKHPGLKLELVVLHYD